MKKYITRTELLRFLEVERSIAEEELEFGEKPSGVYFIEEQNRQRVALAQGKLKIIEKLEKRVK